MTFAPGIATNSVISPNRNTTLKPMNNGFTSTRDRAGSSSRRPRFADEAAGRPGGLPDDAWVRLDVVVEDRGRRTSRGATPFRIGGRRPAAHGPGRSGLQAEDAREGTDEEDEAGAVSGVTGDVSAERGEAEREGDEPHHLPENGARAVPGEDGSLAEPELLVCRHSVAPQKVSETNSPRSPPATFGSAGKTEDLLAKKVRLSGGSATEEDLKPAQFYLFW